MDSDDICFCAHPGLRHDARHSRRGAAAARATGVRVILRGGKKLPENFMMSELLFIFPVFQNVAEKAQNGSKKP
jgi:hypothetical protein